MRFREPLAQKLHIMFGTQTRWLTKFKSPSPVPKPVALIPGKRIHLHSRNGQYIFIGTDAGGNMFITTKEWMRDGECKMVLKTDFKCYAGGHNPVQKIPKGLKVVK